MYKLGIEEIKSLHGITTIDKHMVIIDDVNRFKSLDQHDTAEIALMIAFFCQRGSVTMVIDGQEISVHEGQILTLFPTNVISSVESSDDLNGFMVVAAPERLESYILFSKNIWSYITYLRDNPVITPEGDDQELVNCYVELTRKALACSSTKYREDLAVSLMQSFIFQLVDIVTLPQTHVANENGMLKSQDMLFLNFLAIINENKGRIRFVHEAADQLNVTPKYLSMLVMKVSKKPALQWIHDVTFSEIERQMKFTNRSIKQIANDLNFSNLSFFARFFKARYGMSPTDYRKKIRG